MLLARSFLTYLAVAASSTAVLADVSIRVMADTTELLISKAGDLKRDHTFSGNNDLFDVIRGDGPNNFAQRIVVSGVLSLTSDAEVSTKRRSVRSTQTPSTSRTAMRSSSLAFGRIMSLWRAAGAGAECTSSAIPAWTAPRAASPMGASERRGRGVSLYLVMLR